MGAWEGKVGAKVALAGAVWEDWKVFRCRAVIPRSADGGERLASFSGAAVEST